MDGIRIETDLFEHRQAKPHFINPCCFGEDFAAWLKQRLASSCPGYAFSDPIQEDYGWGFWCSHGRERLWVAISYVGDGPQEAPAEWVVSVSEAIGLNALARFFGKRASAALTELRDRVEQTLIANRAIRIVDRPRSD